MFRVCVVWMDSLLPLVGLQLVYFQHLFQINWDCDSQNLLFMPFRLANRAPFLAPTASMQYHTSSHTVTCSYLHFVRPSPLLLPDHHIIAAVTASSNQVS
jgi:hypothetical protein